MTAAPSPHGRVARLCQQLAPQRPCGDPGPSPPSWTRHHGAQPSGAAAAGLPDAEAQQRAAAEYHDRGYVVVRQLLPLATVSALRRALAAYIADEVPTQTDDDGLRLYEGADRDPSRALKYISFRAFNHLPHESAYEPLRSLPLLPGLEALARACLRLPEQPLTFATKWLDKPPVDRADRSATPPHQDQWYFSAQHPATDSAPPLLPLCSFWLALEPVDSGNGCLRYYPHSHRLGLLPHEGGGPRGFSQRIGDRTAASALGAAEAVALEPGDGVL